MDISTDLSCRRTTDPNMALSSSLGLDITMALGGSVGHSDQYGPSGSLTLGHQHSLRWWPKPWVSAQPSMETGAMDIHTDPGYGRITDPDMLLGRSLGQDMTMAPGWQGARVAACSHCLLFSSVVCLCLSFLHQIFAHHNDASKAPCGPVRVLPPARAELYQGASEGSLDSFKWSERR